MEPEWLSDDEFQNEQPKFINPDILKYADEIIPKSQLAKNCVIPIEPVPFIPVIKASPTYAVTEFFKQLETVPTYNQDLSSTPMGQEILKSMINTKNSLHDVVTKYKIAPNTSLNSVFLLYSEYL